ncbi:unnamed protein product [Didymodactylos carnosus]|uniref:Uncharacterized protein n=1 Tax=Didymodactylos carnosus TaxID=1234261 RepID=A0A815L1P9_9BILA|nr:unnamed protein product [Didymodactylos carnosus]CAF4295219.1 unnamed protein product [Didymodactylos carnosus]
MAMSQAERAKKYREKIKKDKVKYEAAKGKARVRGNSKREKLTGLDLAAFRLKNKINQVNFRKSNKKRLNTKTVPSAFKSRQSFGKCLKTVNSTLPKCDKKKKIIVQHLAQKFGLIPKPTHHRTSVQLSEKLKKDIYNFYVRDDVSYQLPGKRDTIVVKDDDGQKTTYQKRILINNFRENYELFKVENKNVDLSHSAFADLRRPFVVSKAALARRVCVCVYHANGDLFLKSLDKCIAEKVCSSLETFTQSLVCNTENEECMFSQCPLCEN